MRGMPASVSGTARARTRGNVLARNRVLLERNDAAVRGHQSGGGIRNGIVLAPVCHALPARGFIVHASKHRYTGGRAEFAYARALRLVAQDTALSGGNRGSESPRERHFAA